MIDYEKELRALLKRIDELSNLKFCPNCGFVTDIFESDTRKNEQFCSFCNFRITGACRINVKKFLLYDEFMRKTNDENHTD